MWWDVALLLSEATFPHLCTLPCLVFRGSSRKTELVLLVHVLYVNLEGRGYVGYVGGSACVGCRLTSTMHAVVRCYCGRGINSIKVK